LGGLALIGLGCGHGRGWFGAGCADTEVWNRGHPSILGKAAVAALADLSTML